MRRTRVRRFHLPVCAVRPERVQGRHPLQTSGALGAAAIQAEPEAVTPGVLMNKSPGLPHADAAAILPRGFRLTMSRSGICRAIQRVGRKAEATWHALRDAARRSTLAHIDQTGWKAEAQLRWLRAVVTEQVTFCEILPGRGFARAAAIPGAEYAGWWIHVSSVLCTARQQDKDVFALLVSLLRAPQPKLRDILPAETGAIAGAIPAASAARGDLEGEALPACADIPLPVLLPPPGILLL